MSTRPVSAMTESVARQILSDARKQIKINESETWPSLAVYLAVELADEILARNGWKVNSCKPLLRAYEMARAGTDR